MTHPNASRSRAHSLSKNTGASMQPLAQAWRQSRTHASYAITACHGPRALNLIYEKWAKLVNRIDSRNWFIGQLAPSALNCWVKNTLHEMLAGEQGGNLKAQQSLQQLQFCKHRTKKRTIVMLIYPNKTTNSWVCVKWNYTDVALCAPNSTK